jgi:environmental stress-induced protein Ves
MPWHRFERATLPATPWKNGGGVTREIVCQPPGTGLDAFDWRVSIATIASDGPFSAFPGVDRVITLLEGGGVHLSGDADGIDHRLDMPLQPYAFAGEARIHARLLAGDCDDFNVMTRRASCQASVIALREATALSAPQGLLLALKGHWRAQAEVDATQALSAQQGLWWDRQAAWHLSPQTADATLLAVTIHPQTATPS